MRKILILPVLALALPALALAAQPSPPGKSQSPHGKSAPKVQYVLTGAVTSFTPSVDGADGSITFTVTKSNRHRAALKGRSLTLVVKPGTKVVLDADGQLNPGEKAIVKLRAAKRTTDAVALLDGTIARQVIDQEP